MTLLKPPVAPFSSALDSKALATLTASTSDFCDFEFFDDVDV